MESIKWHVSLCHQLYLYGKGVKHISYNEFVNRELILFSNMDNERSIPSLVDGGYSSLEQWNPCGHLISLHATN